MLKSNRIQPHYNIGDKLLVYEKYAIGTLEVAVRYTPITIINTKDQIIEYSFNHDGKSFTSTTNWHNISKDKFDLVYNTLIHTINDCWRRQRKIEELISINKDREYFNEAYYKLLMEHPEEFIKYG